MFSRRSRGWQNRSLRSKLLWPVVGLMLISLLGSTAAFVAGTALTRNQFLEQQIERDADRVDDALTARVEVIADGATLLANDPEVIEAVGVDSEEALALLNSRALRILNRFNFHLVQLYDAHGQARTNLMVSSLYHESTLLEQVQEGTPTVEVIEGSVLLLTRTEMPGDAGTVIVGIDLQAELDRLLTRYRLPSDLGLALRDGTRIGTTESLPFDSPGGQAGGQYSRWHSLILGSTPIDLLLVRSTEDTEQVTRTGLIVMTASTVLTTVLLVGLSVGMTSAVVGPIRYLSVAADALAGGDLAHRVEPTDLANLFSIGTGDEIGVLARAFNGMASDLRELYADLEGKIQARTQELSVTAEVARAVSSSLEADVILHTVVQLIHQRLGIDYVGVFVIEPGSRVAVLREAAGKAAEPLLAGEVTFPLSSKALVCVAAVTGQPRVVEDLRSYPLMLDNPFVAQARSAAVVPLLAGPKAVGVLDLQSSQSDAFGPDLINLLATLSDQIAVGLENALRYESEQRRRQLAEALARTGRALSDTLDVEEVGRRILNSVDALVPYERGSVLLRDGEVLRPLAHRGFPDDERAEGIRVPIGVGDIFAQLEITRRPMIIDDVTQEPGWQQLPWLEVHRSWLGVPIISKGRVIGMVSLTRREVGGFVTDDAVWVQPFALQAGSALENARLYLEISQFNQQLEHLVDQRTRALNDAYRRLEQLDRTKSQFISVAAHELRTPLTVIRGYAQMLATMASAPDGMGAKTVVDGVMSGIDRLHRVVNSMLDVAKIDSQTLQMARGRVRLSEVIDHVRGRFRSSLSKRDLTLTVADLGKLPPVVADVDLLKKVFHHLIENGIKFTPDGGQIRVEGFVVRDNGRRAFVEIVISDTGIGIDPEHQDLIFEKFYQTGEVALHSSGETKFKGGGPGLGLAIARGIVAAHGGQIWVESQACDEEACPGSAFHVRLPIEPSGGAAGQGERLASSEGCGG